MSGEPMIPEPDRYTGADEARVEAILDAIGFGGALVADPVRMAVEAAVALEVLGIRPVMVGEAAARTLPPIATPFEVGLATGLALLLPHTIL